MVGAFCDKAATPEKFLMAGEKGWLYLQAEPHSHGSEWEQTQ